MGRNARGACGLPPDGEGNRWCRGADAAGAGATAGAGAGAGAGATVQGRGETETRVRLFGCIFVCLPFRSFVFCLLVGLRVFLVCLLDLFGFVFLCVFLCLVLVECLFGVCLFV